MFLTKIFLILLALNFIKYASTIETININEWLTKINTKRNRIIAKFAIYFDLFGWILSSAIVTTLFRK